MGQGSIAAGFGGGRGEVGINAYRSAEKKEGGSFCSRTSPKKMESKGGEA